MAKILKSLGFEVIHKSNADKAAMLKAATTSFPSAHMLPVRPMLLKKKFQSTGV